MEEFEAMEQAGIRQIHENFREGTPGTYIVHPDHRFPGGWNHKGEGKRLDKLLNIFRTVGTDEINLVKKFEESVFGDFVTAHKHREKFGGVVFRHLGFHMVYPDMPDELHFRFISRSARTCVFGRREFASISGLRFGNIENPVGDTSMVFGPGCCLEGRKKSSVSVKNVDNALNFHSTRSGVENAEVLYRLGLVYFIYAYVLGWNENKAIPREIFYIVEDLDLVARFAWGEYLWRITYDKIGHLMASVKSMSETPPPPKSDHKPNVEGWAPGLVYWAYDLCPRFHETEPPFCKRLSDAADAIPRMLRWECVGSTPRGPTMKTHTMPEVGMIDHLVFGADEIAKLIELGLSHDEVTAQPRVFPQPPPQTDPISMSSDPVRPKPRRNNFSKGKRKKKVSFATESSEGSEEEFGERGEDGGGHNEEEANEEHDTGNVGRDACVQQHPLLEAVGKMIAEATDKFLGEVGKVHQRLDDHKILLNYLYEESRQRQRRGRDNPPGNGAAGGRGRGGEGGNVGQSSSLNANVSSPVHQSATLNTSTPVERNIFSSPPVAGWGCSSRDSGVNIAGQTFEDGELLFMPNYFSDNPPPTFNTPEETIGTCTLNEQSENVLGAGPSAVESGKRKADDVDAGESDKRLKNRSSFKIPARFAGINLDTPLRSGPWTPYKRFPDEMKQRFDDWFKNPVPPKVKVPCGKVLDLVEDTEVGKEFFERLATSNLSLENSQVDACIDLMRRQMKRHPEYFRPNIALAFSDFGSYLGDAHYDQNTAIADLEFPQPLLDVVRTWTTDTVVYMPWPIWTGHWAAIEVDISRWRIKVYDCLLRYIDEKEVVGEKIISLGWSVRRVLEMDSELKKLPQFHADAMLPLEVIVADDKEVPQMRTPGDCGVYAVKHIEHLIHDEPLDIIFPRNMPYFRRRLCLELFNQCLDFYS